MPEENETEEAPKRKPRSVAVRLIVQQGQSALVEWSDGVLRRGYVPVEEITDGKAAKDVLAAALPYGVPWGALVDFSGLTPEAFEAKLHGLGIWTVADLERQPGTVAMALAALSTTAGQLHGKARQHTEE